jgi:hypothetical protein
MKVKYSRLVITALVLLFAMGAAFYFIGARDTRAVSVWISRQHTPYRLVVRGYRLPIFPSKFLETPQDSLKCAWRFLVGRTRLDFMRGTVVPSTNVAFTVRSDMIAPEHTD